MKSLLVMLSFVTCACVGEEISGDANGGDSMPIHWVCTCFGATLEEVEICDRTFTMGPYEIAEIAEELFPEHICPHQDCDGEQKPEEACLGYQVTE